MLNRTLIPVLATILTMAVLMGLPSCNPAKEIERKKAEAQKGWALTPVLVAKTDIEEGAIVDRSQIEVRRIPEKHVTPANLRPEATEKIIGQETTQALIHGDPLLSEMFRPAVEATPEPTKAP